MRSLIWWRVWRPALLLQTRHWWPLGCTLASQTLCEPTIGQPRRSPTFIVHHFCIIYISSMNWIPSFELSQCLIQVKPQPLGIAQCLASYLILFHPYVSCTYGSFPPCVGSGFLPKGNFHDEDARVIDQDVSVAQQILFLNRSSRFLCHHNHLNWESVSHTVPHFKSSSNIIGEKK